MHGTMPVAISLRNRRGRKRKQGRRYAGSGNLVDPEKQTQSWEAQFGDAQLLELQPHRVTLPKQHRGDHRAGSVLGKLMLTGQLAPPEEGKVSGRAQRLHEAGRRYAVIVGAYWAVIGTPRATAGSGRGYPCLGDGGCPLKDCECVRRKKAYNDAHECLVRDKRQQVTVTVARVAVYDEECHPAMLPALIRGLGILAKHFGLER